MVNVLFCGNDKVFDGVLSASLSLMKRSRKEEVFRFFVFTMDVHDLNEKYLPMTQRQCAFFEQVIKGYNPANSVKLVDVTHWYEEYFRGCPNEGCYCSPYTLIRLFADLDEEIASLDKLLYLDCDVLACKDIRLLYDIDVTGYEYAAGPDHYGKRLVSPRYINAGVLLFNMAMCRETRLFEKSRRMIQAKHLPFADQSAIRGSTTRFLFLKKKYNDQFDIHKDTVIRHFSQRLFFFPPRIENVKQWNVVRLFSVFGYKYSQFEDILLEYVYLKYKFEREFCSEN